MCGSLTLAAGEKMRTEAALRKVLGEGARRWSYEGSTREEGLRVEEDDEGAYLSWGGQKKRWAVEEVLAVPIGGFWDKSRETKHDLFFKEEGKILVPVYVNEQEGRKVISFRIVTAFDRRVASLCQHDRGPLIMPVADERKPQEFLMERILIRAADQVLQAA